MRQLATPFHRLIGFLIDTFLPLLPFLFLLAWIFSTPDVSTLLDRVLWVIVIDTFGSLAITFLNSFLISKFGGTLGKLLTGIKIVRGDGSNIGYLRAIFRSTIGYSASAMVALTGFWWMLINKERRTWHDLLSDTYVVISGKIGIVLGIVILGVLIGLNISAGKKVIQNFQRNQATYQNFVQNLNINNP